MWTSGRLLGSFGVLASAILIVLLIIIIQQSAIPVSGDTSTLFVSLDNDCKGESPCHTTIQSAVDAAKNGDVIKIASGLYTSTATEVAFVNKSVLLQGGFVPTNWNEPDPYTHPTILDAEIREGSRALYIDGMGAHKITVSGLLLQNGCPLNFGGNLYAVDATLAISNTRIRGSGYALPNGHHCVAYGGGLYIKGGKINLYSSVVEKNFAAYGGAGIAINGSEVAVMNSEVVSNEITNHGNGGGLSIYGTPEVVVTDSKFIGNAANYGGALYVTYGNVVIARDNHFAQNSATEGGAIYLQERTTMHLESNTLVSNTATLGGAIYSNYENSVTGKNDIFAKNQAPQAIYFGWDGNISALHWTFADNGSYAVQLSDTSSGTFTNTIVAGHEIAGLDGRRLRANYLLTAPSDLACGSYAQCSNVVVGNPDFANSDLGDYRLNTASSAIDAGINAGVLEDFEGELRPMINAFDIGADERNPQFVATSTRTPTSTPTSTVTPTPTSTPTPTYMQQLPFVLR